MKGWNELLLPARDATEAEVAAVKSAKETFLAREDAEDVSAWTAFLAQQTTSPYRLAVLVNLASGYFKTGRFSGCLNAYEDAWEIGKELRGTPVEMLAGRAAGELAMMYARLGRYEELEALLNETKDKPFQGPGSNLLTNAQSGFELMTVSPGTSFRCGPMALSRILASQGRKDVMPTEIRESVSTRQGISLAKVQELAGEVGLGNLKASKRVPGSEVLVPSVVHWKEGHYAAVVQELNGKYLLEDSTFALLHPIWVTKATLDEEASGYFLADLSQNPAGWSAINAEEAGQVWGRGETASGDPEATGPNDRSAKNESSGGGEAEGECGMAQWDIHLMLVSLNIRDKPLGYTPPVGPPVMVTATYNSRQNQSIATTSHTNFGPKWSLSSVAYLIGDTSSVTVVGGYGASESYQGAPGQPGLYRRNKKSYSMILRSGLTSFYTRQWPDGTEEEYGYEGPTGTVYRTKLRDPSGNELTYHYSNIGGYEVVLTKITDAIGQETLFEYANGGLTPTKITDPFGRTATFAYNDEKQLISITDMIGIQSAFTYLTNSDFIETMTTPYGTTQFETGSQNAARWMQVTHPNGDMERAEFRHNGEGVGSNPGAIPDGIMVDLSYHNYRNSFYWDRKAMKEGAGDVTKAKLTHFLHMHGNVYMTSPLVESEKEALEERVFYNYAGQQDPITESADSSRVSKIARRLEDGTTQLYEMEYNEAGKPTRLKDPDGRITLIEYAENFNDVTAIRQQVTPPVPGVGGNPGTPAVTVLLASYTYNGSGHPLTFTDAGGNVTSFTYNPRGQMLTMTQPGGATTEFTYDGNGYMTSVQGALGGTADNATFGYDGKGRLNSVTDAAGMTLTTQYDNLNRVVSKAYPDGSTEQWTYEAMRPKTFRTRNNRQYTYKYNSMAQLVEIADHDNRKTLLDWCKCGDLKTIIDPMQRMTKFFHDVQGRLTGKQYADGSTTQIQYEPIAGRMKKLVDEEGREQTFTYTKSNQLAGISYSGTGNPAPPMTLTWDPAFVRLSSYTDGTGTTNLTYKPMHTNVPGTAQGGAGRLASVDGPMANDVIDYNYDAKGQMTSRSIGGITESYSYDALGRMAGMNNPLGIFGYAYEQASQRVSTVTMPNGAALEMTYFNNAGLRMLKDLTNKKGGGAEVSKFSYTYNMDSNITSLTRHSDGGAGQMDNVNLDGVGRLTGYQKALSGGGSKNYTYSYDAAGNRETETIDGTPTQATHNLLNQVTHLTPSPAVARSYEWDRAGRLSAIVQGTHRTEFGYDAFGRKARIRELENGVEVADRRFLWVGFQLAQERTAAGAVVKQFFRQGFTTSAGSFYYMRDHLGSIREVVDGTGAVRARYDYDPFGRRVKLAGDIDSDFGFTGALYHEPSQLCLMYARAYDANLGRWISRDPEGEGTSPNLYAYVKNNPVRYADLLGMDLTEYSPSDLASGKQYADMSINAGKLLIGAAALGGAVGALSVTIAAAPLMGAAAATAGIVITAGAAVWAGYGVMAAGKNYMLNATGYNSDGDFDGNPIKDYWKICGDENSTEVKHKRAARDIAAVAGDIFMGKIFGAWVGNSVGISIAAGGMADQAGNITGFMDLQSAFTTAHGGITSAF